MIAAVSITPAPMPAPPWGRSSPRTGLRTRRSISKSARSPPCTALWCWRTPVSSEGSSTPIGSTSWSLVWWWTCSLTPPRRRSVRADHRPLAGSRHGRHADMKRLTGTDALFLSLETPNWHQHVGGLTVIDPQGGTITYEDIVANL